ncbi:MAG: methyltransferase domain-containing protein [Candidatus Omnitrophica bacterium]|nr:methyltransferase domain-containing protein [Candidatus Omnitrophota bacterium]
MIIAKSEYDRACRWSPGESGPVTVDFGMKTVTVKREKDRILFSSGARIPITLKLKDKFCYLIEKTDLVPCAFYSEETCRFYKLIPTKDLPSIAIGSTPMHSITRVSPAEDTERKLTLIRPQGRVLDTCMGLGYTAIGAARSSAEVITFEKDPNVIILAKWNPHSHALFTDKKIKIVKKDISQEISRFPHGHFDCIIHDPPTFTIAPELFGDRFYKELYRVLKPKGELYHYLPLYRIRQGYDFPSKIKGRLKKTGFTIIRFLPQEGNLLCRK